MDVVVSPKQVQQMIDQMNAKPAEGQQGEAAGPSGGGGDHFNSPRDTNGSETTTPTSTGSVWSPSPARGNGSTMVSHSGNKVCEDGGRVASAPPHRGMTI